MLVKLTPGVNFINVFKRSFYTRRFQKRKKLLELIIFFALLGSARVKVACKMLVKLTPWQQVRKVKSSLIDGNNIADGEILIFINRLI